MQFTPQQMAGAGRFSSKTRIGNWQEDVWLEDIKYADFRRRKDKNELVMGAMQSKLVTCTQQVPHSYSEDGMLRFGDTIQLYNDETGSYLACDPWEEVHCGVKEYLVSGVKSKEVMARNTFVITRCEDKYYDNPTEQLLEKNDILKYGEPFHLVTNPSILVDPRTDMLRPPYYLTSHMKTQSKASRVSNKQMVYLSMNCDKNTVWKCQIHSRGNSDGVIRLFAEGQPVKNDHSLVLFHKSTKVPLATDSRFKENTDFGTEYEVVCHNYCSNAKSELLLKERSGEKIPNTISKTELPQVKWQFVTASDPSAAVDNRKLPVPLTAEALVAKVRDTLLAKGESLTSLRNTFKKMDEGGDSKLDRDDLKWGLREQGIHFLTDEEFEIIMNYFDKSGDGLVDITEFMVGIRGQLNARRRAIVELAYHKLDTTKDGVVTAEDIRHVYDTSAHPKVIAGLKEPDEVLTEFLSAFESKSKDKDGVITKDEFMEYYNDVGVEIDNDEYFEIMVRKAWNMRENEDEYLDGGDYKKIDADDGEFYSRKE